ncbi:MAG: BTAD domain-containing putative transcriptional regulator [Caldilineaceae bacterium]
MHPLFAIRLFGGIHLFYDGAALSIPKNRKGLALFLYLACTGQVHTREALADLLWDATSTKQSLSNLRTTLSRLPAPLSDHLLIRRETIAVDPTRPLLLDAAALERTVEAMTSPLRTPGASQLAAALECYQGDFLAGFQLQNAPRFADWVLLTRERLRQAAWRGFEQLTTYALVSGAYDQGVALASQWLQLEPHDESMHMQLLRLFAAQGARPRVRTHYANYQHYLRAEYALEPGAELQACYAQLVQAGREISQPTPIRHNLPAFPTSFVGRARELAQLQTLLGNPQVQLVTITGIGGIGKTRLAVTAAAQMRAHFATAIWFVPLANAEPTTAQTAVDPVIAAISDALHLTLDVKTPALGQLLAHLQQHPALLILDNFEHLMASTPQVAELLAGAPQLTMLITSRARLNLRQEWAFPLAGLSVSAQPETPPADLADASAIALFSERARQHDPNFDATTQQTALRQICQLVGGMPLAIELAAAWVALLTPNSILDELAQSLDLLSTTSPNVPARHQTMRAVFAGSWQALEDAARVAFTGLAVFRGGFTREAAQAVSGLSLGDLQTLVHKSLLRVDQTLERYEMHELLRRYALEKLAAEPTYHQQVHVRHSHYYCRWLQRQEAALKGAGTVYQLRRLDSELGNMNAAWGWALAHEDDQLLFDTADSFFTYYLVRSRDPAGRALVEQTLAALPAKAVDAPQAALLRAQLCLTLRPRRRSAYATGARA